MASSDVTLPIIDLDVFLKSPNSPEALAESKKALNSLIEYGALLLRDSRVNEEDNAQFLDLMEDYFAQDAEELKKDTRPEVYYQVGATLENTEKPACHSNESCLATIASLDPAERPLDMTGEHADPKCRFFHRMGATPPTTSFPSLNMTNVIPAAFASTWEASMEAWGQQMKHAVEGCARMVGAGLGVGDSILEMGKFGSHLLAPTATDLKRFGKEGEIFAGFHTDLNCLTIHGRSRYPGLNIWARNTGKRITVKLPPGVLLVQAAKQLEHLTAGLILAGYHEVICSPATMSTIERRLADPATTSRPLIRISSTFFWHLGADEWLESGGFLKTVREKGLIGGEEKEEARLKEAEERSREEKYGKLQVGTLVQNELKHISLMA